MKAADKCPFMMNALRTMSTSSTETSTAEMSNASSANHQSAQKCTQQEFSHNQNEAQTMNGNNSIEVEPKICTEPINCPFFKTINLDMNKLIVERKLDHSDEISHISKRHRMINNKENIDIKKIKTATKPKELAPLTARQTFDYEKFFENKIRQKKEDGSYRYFKKVLRNSETFPVIQEWDQEKAIKDITVWCSNDYLGLGRHPYIQAKVNEAVLKHGVGSGGTRNISGSTPLHDQLERELAEIHQKEAALVFTSCYVANDTTLYTLARMLPDCHILSDSGNHASMIQGIRNSGIPRTIFRHNDCEHLEEILSKLPKNTPKIVAFESVHSMDGSICELERMCDITLKYGGISYIDEVHAVGLYGRNGGGVGERDNCLAKMDIITGTLGKAFGNIGGYVAGSANLIDTMRSYGSGFIFTTSLPPSVVAGALAAVQISRSDEGQALRDRHQLNAKIVKDELKKVGLPVIDSPSHIVPIMVGDVKKAGEMCDRLMNEHGIYIQAINYPTVARGQERLRIAPNPHHTPQMIRHLVDSLVQVWTKVVGPLQSSSNQVTKNQTEQTKLGGKFFGREYNNNSAIKNEQ